MSPNSLEHNLVSRISHRQLRLILVLDRTRSITEAAKVLNITQPAISKAVRELESSIGVEIFERRYRHVIPTKVGSHLITCAENILSELTRTSEKISSALFGSTARIVIGILPTTTFTLHEKIIPEVQRRHPLVHIEIETGTMDQLFRELAIGRIDFALGQIIDRTAPAGIVSESVHESVMQIIVGPGAPWEALKGPGWHAALESMPWCLPSRRLPLRRHINRALSSLQIEPRATLIELSSQELLYRLVANNAYATVVAQLHAQIYTAFSPIKVLPVALVSDALHYCIYTKEGAPINLVRDDSIHVARTIIKQLTQRLS